tara:strand:+ start:8060 stop:8326 length:267 start_codon:yes stop_codon:yes gene_type:complete
MTKKDYKNFEKDKIQSLQQKIDELEEKIQFLNNELLLNKELKKDIKLISKKNTTATPLPKFYKPDVNRYLKGRAKALAAYSKRLDESE